MFQSLRSKLILTLLMSLCISLPISTIHATTDTYKSVFKIKVYSRNSLSGNYSFSHYGSAVLVDSNRIITNAHVILDANDDTPTWYYEVCQSKSNKEAPICFTTATLEHYDELQDVARLKLNQPAKWVKPLTIKENKHLNIGEKVTVFWYPSIGWRTITRTEWTIWGVDTDGLYKFDGTLDHWNSGWAALNAQWELIWIPRAIKSENGVIWYIIPSHLIMSSEKTKSGDMPKDIDTVGFSKYIGSIQSGYGKNIIKDSKVEINNITKNWFTLINKIIGSSWSSMHYHFTDKTDRTSLIVTCWTEAYTTWASSIELNQKFAELIQHRSQNIETMSWEFMNQEKSIYMLERIDKADKNGDKGAMRIYVYKDHPTCMTYVISTDWIKKDNQSYTNAQKIISSIKFKKTWTITKDFDSVFFKMKNIPNNTSISEAHRFTYWYGIYPEINVLFPSSKWYATSEFEVIEFDSLDGYMNYWYSDSSKYNGKNYTFQDFFNRYKTTKYVNVEDHELTTNEQKTAIFTVEDYIDSIKYPNNPTQKVIFFYPFSLWEWKLYAYRVEFILYSDDRQDIHTVRDILKKLELPWVSPFKK